MPRQTPSVGRVVHYVATNGAHVPADICGVFEDESVNLFVKDSTTSTARFEYSVPEDPTGQAPGSWHWPEYVPAKDEPVF
jgi:hypothetical protein